MKRIDRERLEELWLKGVYVKDIAGELGCSRATVNTRRKEMGLALRGKRRVNIDSEELRMLWERGVSARKIAVELGRSPPTILAWSKAMGLPARDIKPRSSKSIDLEELRTMSLQGVTIREMAKRLKCSTITINKWRKKLKLPSRPRGNFTYAHHKFTLSVKNHYNCPFYISSTHYCLFRTRLENHDCILHEGKTTCTYIRLINSAVMHRDWYKLNQLYLLCSNSRLFLEVMVKHTGYSKTYLTTAMGLSLATACRRDETCPYKPLLSEYVLEEKKEE